MSEISANNRARQQAAAAYQAGRYAHALTIYAALSRTTTTIDPAIRLNLGHTYFQLQRYTKARQQYETLLQSDRPDLRTVAATQLGVISCVQRDSGAALLFFEKALLEDPNNEPARYNFELIRKQYSGKLPQPATRKKSAAKKQESVGTNSAMGRQQVEQSARQDEVLRRFQRMNLNEEQALQLLNAMQDDDLPYALTRLARQAAKKSGTTKDRW